MQRAATATGVDGGSRTRQVRSMVGALHGLGLRVVLDQVYNHTDGAGQGGTSVLDRIVPGYYHRRAADGTIATSTMPSLKYYKFIGATLTAGGTSLDITGFELTIDLERQTVATTDGALVYGFAIDASRKHRLLNGLDDIGLTLQHAEAIRAFEAKRLADNPWL